MNCIIVDDEPLALDLLEDYISKVPFLKLIARCTNAIDAIEAIQANPIDLVFSDIQMQGLNGMQLIKTLAVKPMFIMVTAYNTYALEGYELDVVDYLLKPAPFDRFVKACYKALNSYNLRQKEPEAPDHVFFHADYSLVKVMLDEVSYIEAIKDYVKIHYTNGKRPFLVRHSMKGIEDVFPQSRFLRIHKSYIVNTACISAVRKNSVFINDFELPVSEQYKDIISQITNKKI